MTPGQQLLYRKRKKRGKNRGYKIITTQGEFVGYHGDRVLVRNKHGMVFPVPLYNIVDSAWDVEENASSRITHKRSANDHSAK